MYPYPAPAFTSEYEVVAVIQIRDGDVQHRDFNVCKRDNDVAAGFGEGQVAHFVCTVANLDLIQTIFEVFDIYSNLYVTP